MMMGVLVVVAGQVLLLLFAVHEQVVAGLHVRAALVGYEAVVGERLARRLLLLRAATELERRVTARRLGLEARLALAADAAAAAGGGRGRCRDALWKKRVAAGACVHGAGYGQACGALVRVVVGVEVIGRQSAELYTFRADEK